MGKKHPNAIDNATSENSLYIDASKLDFGNTTIFDLKDGVGATSDINTYNAGNTVNSLFNSKLRHPVYAMGRITLLLNDSSGTVTIENNDASVYDWNNGGTLIRRVAISAERGLHNLNDSHGFPVYYYGTGHIRK